MEHASKWDGILVFFELIEPFNVLVWMRLSTSRSNRLQSSTNRWVGLTNVAAKISKWKTAALGRLVWSAILWQVVRQTNPVWRGLDTAAERIATNDTDSQDRSFWAVDPQAIDRSSGQGRGRPSLLESPMKFKMGEVESAETKVCRAGTKSEVWDLIGSYMNVTIKGVWFCSSNDCLNERGCSLPNKVYGF